MENKRQKPQEKPKKSLNQFTRYSAMGIQMAVIIGGLSWLGDYLDERRAAEFPTWTLILSLFGVSAALFLMIKDLIKLSK